MTSRNPERERRLAEALRANLRRRKGQARDRVREGEEVADGAAAPASQGPDSLD